MKEKTKMICIKVSPKEFDGIHKRMVLFGKLDDAFNVTLNATVLC